jgi:CheY-like chemotaxis protein
MTYAATTALHSVIMIVEDEYLVRMNAAAMMEEAGFDVLEAGNADEAIRLLESNPDISIVFTDIEMPGSMNGLKLAHAVTGRWPPIRIIATSGRFKVNDGDLPAGGRFLPKHYSAGQILGALREMGGGA